jgi:hypothetical protein
VLARALKRKRREGRFEERHFEPNTAEGEPKRSKAHESNGSRPDLNPRGALRDTAFKVGISRWSAGTKLIRFGKKAPERKRNWESQFPITLKEQSSEGRSPRALGAERGPQGFEALAHRRKGSQTLRAGLSRCTATRFERFERSEKKGAWIRIC